MNKIITILEFFQEWIGGRNEMARWNDDTLMVFRLENEDIELIKVEFNKEKNSLFLILGR